MAADRIQPSHVILALLASGFLFALLDLIGQTRGRQAAFVAGAAGCVLACVLCVRPTSKRNLSRNLIRSAPMVLLLSVLISLSSNAPGILSSSLCWSALMACAVMAAGAMTINTDSMGNNNASTDCEIEEPFEQGCSVGASALFEFDQVTRNDEGEVDLEDDDVDGTLTRDHLLQSWTRVQNEAEDRLDGILNVEMAAGQKQCYLHVPFVPFFSVIPSGWCECAGDDSVEAEFDSLQLYGARLSIRRRGDLSTPSRNEITVVVTAERMQLRAAS